MESMSFLDNFEKGKSKRAYTTVYALFVEFVQNKQRADRIHGLPYLFSISQNAISVKPLRRKSPEKARKSAKNHRHKI